MWTSVDTVLLIFMDYVGINVDISIWISENANLISLRGSTYKIVELPEIETHFQE